MEEFTQSMSSIKGSHEEYDTIILSIKTNGLFNLNREESKKTVIAEKGPQISRPCYPIWRTIKHPEE